MPWRISISVGCGLLSSNAFAAKIIPGVQNPHCTAPYSAKAFCTGCNCSPWASPSMVVTSRPWASSAKIRQESTVLPSSSTVQAPHSPSLQPSLVPVRCNSSRSSCNNDCCGSIATSYGVPFTVSVMRRFTSLSCVCSPRHVLLEHLQHTQGRLYTALAQYFHHVFAIRRRTAHV